MKLLQTKVQELKARYLKYFIDYSDIVIVVADSIDYRVFELETLYEFDEHQNIDCNNVDFLINVNIKRNEEVEVIPLTFRLKSLFLPRSGYISFTNVLAHEELENIHWDLIELVTTTLGFRYLQFGIYENKMGHTLVKHLTPIDSYQNGQKINIYSKKL